MRIYKIFSVALCTLLLSSCARDMASTTYVDSATSGKVIEGKIVALRTVTVKAHDKLQDNTSGALLGGAALGAAGSETGAGSGNIAATVGGAVVGAVAGAMIQDALTTSEAVEYLVKIDKQYLQEYRSVSKRVQVNNKQTVAQDMAATTVGTKTDIVSIVQEEDEALHKGSRVYVVYTDDRAHLIAQD